MVAVPPWLPRPVPLTVTVWPGTALVRDMPVGLAAMSKATGDADGGGTVSDMYDEFDESSGTLKVTATLPSQYCEGATMAMCPLSVTVAADDVPLQTPPFDGPAVHTYDAVVPAPLMLS